MKKAVGLGIQSFEKIRQRQCFYIDKTDFIRAWWENADDVTLITRPRRFGKTLTMSMLEQFLSVEYAGRGEELFGGLAIWKEEKYRNLQGTCPVISLSFADVKETSFSEARKKICQIIEGLYNEYDFLPGSGHLNEKEKIQYQNVSASMEKHVATDALKALSKYLSSYYGKKVIILLDEYDTPMQEAYMYGYWDELSAFIRGIFNAAFKTNPYLDRAVMTGITRVSKESIFSDLNNLTVVTTTSDLYADAFGFTKGEVYAALKEYGLEEQMAEVRLWYDGFTFGNQREIYNPWSILNYLKTGRFSAYWANTSSNHLMNRLIRQGGRRMKLIMEDLLKGESFHTQIDEQIVFGQLDTRENAVWSLLLASGYLRVEKLSRNGRGGEEYDLALTNREVHLMFEQMIDGWFAQQTPAYNDFIQALEKGDLDAMNEYMNRISMKTFSYFDTGQQPSAAEPERFYHGFVLGLMVDLADRYTILSNRESGFGRYDVMLEPLHLSDHAYILEFKVRNPKYEKNLEETVSNALAQIKEKEYALALTQKGVPQENIYCYGFAFEGKTVLIG